MISKKWNYKALENGLFVVVFDPIANAFPEWASLRCYKGCKNVVISYHAKANV